MTAREILHYILETKGDKDGLARYEIELSIENVYTNKDDEGVYKLKLRRESWNVKGRVYGIEIIIDSNKFSIGSIYGAYTKMLDKFMKVTYDKEKNIYGITENEG